MNGRHSVRGFASKWLAIAIAVLAVCFVGLVLARTFRLGPLIRERLVATNEELKAIGTQLRVSDVVGDNKSLRVEVNVGAAPRGYRFRAATFCVVAQSVDAASLSKSVEGGGAPPACSQEQTSRDRESSFTVLRSALGNTYLVITFEDAGGIRFWGSDVRQYLIPAASVPRSVQ